MKLKCLIKGLVSRVIVRKAIRKGVLPKNSRKHYRNMIKAGITT